MHSLEPWEVGGDQRASFSFSKLWTLNWIFACHNCQSSKSESLEIFWIVLLTARKSQFFCRKKKKKKRPWGVQGTLRSMLICCHSHAELLPSSAGMSVPPLTFLHFNSLPILVSSILVGCNKRGCYKLYVLLQQWFCSKSKVVTCFFVHHSSIRFLLWRFSLLFHRFALALLVFKWSGMIDDDDDDDEDARVNEIEADVQIISLWKKQNREPPFLGMSLCDWSTLILIRLLTVLLSVVEMFCVVLLSSFKVLSVEFWKMVAGSKLLIV